MNGAQIGALGVVIAVTRRNSGWRFANFYGVSGWLLCMGHVNVTWLPTTNKMLPNATVF